MRQRYPLKKLGCFLGLTLFSLHCASAGRDGASRTFSRKGLEQLPLKKVRIIALAATPQEEASADLSEVAFFLPPTWTAPLNDRVLSSSISQALQNETEVWLRKAGFEVEEGRPEGSLQNQQVQSKADALLILRAVPLDAFMLQISDINSAGPDITTTLQLQQINRKSKRFAGRLFFGQAFLFDRETGARLWSRQLPDFPESQELVPGHPQLQYGIVLNDGEALDAPREQLAAARFISKILAPFPQPQSSRPNARELVLGGDLAFEEAEQAFFDQNHLLVEVDAHWGIGQVGSALAPLAEGVPLPELDTGALAPAGTLGFRAGLRNIWPGGWFAKVDLGWSSIPNHFEQVFHRDLPNQDELGEQTPFALNGGDVVGGTASTGPAFLLSESFSLLLGAGVFLEHWDFAVQQNPKVRLSSPEHWRVGLALETDLLIRPELSSRWFGRIGVRGQLGGDTAGPLVIGGGLVLGLGVAL